VTAESLVRALTGLRDALGAIRLPLALPLAKDGLDTARQLTTQLDDYVLPRLTAIEAPLLVVVGGSTGAGKSTLVNTLVGREVSRPGVIRPTTKSPVLVMNQADERWFASERILPGLVRTFGPLADDTPGKLRLVAEPSLPVGLAILDAPDIDSVVTENRQLAAQLLQAADLWLFVTSAARYSDAVPWEFLAAAASRSAVVAIVLDRVPDKAMDVVPDDMSRLMAKGGLGQSRLFVVPEHKLNRHGLLPDSSVKAIRDWLAGLAASETSRRQVVLQTLDGAIQAVADQASVVADAADQQVTAYRGLEADAEAAYREAQRQVVAQAGDGSLLRGEVLARWHDYVGTTAFVRALDQKVSWVRDKLSAFFGGRSDGSSAKEAAEAGLQVLVAEAAEQAASRAWAAWQAQPPGRVLLGGRDDLRRASGDFAKTVARSIDAWQGDVLDLVSQEGAGKRQTARLAAAGVNGVGAALMLVIFASTGGLTGAELGIAGGTTVIAQKLLESIFGDEAVRKLATTAKANLIARIDGLLAGEQARYIALLDGLGLVMDAAARVDQAIDNVTAERAAGYDEEWTMPNQPDYDKEAFEPTTQVRPVRPEPAEDAFEQTHVLSTPSPVNEASEQTHVIVDTEAMQPTTVLPLAPQPPVQEPADTQPQASAPVQEPTDNQPQTSWWRRLRKIVS